jgi:hypothetical protein
MDPNAALGVVFTLLLVMMIGGFIVLMPLTRRLGLLLEQRLQSKSGAGLPAGREVEELRRMLEQMQVELDQVVERQEFLDKLLAAPGSDPRIQGR